MAPISSSSAWRHVRCCRKTGVKVWRTAAERAGRRMAASLGGLWPALGSRPLRRFQARPDRRADRRAPPNGQSRAKSRAENSRRDLPLEPGAGHEQRREQGRGAGHRGAALAVDQQAPVTLETTEGLLDLPPPRLDREAGLVLAPDQLRRGA